MAKRYPVSLVGEQHYASACAKARRGHVVRLLHEPDNPYDKWAIVAHNSSGETLGYVPKDSFLRRSMHEEHRTWRAVVGEIYDDGPFRQVRLKVWIDEEDDDDDDDDDLFDETRFLSNPAAPMSTYNSAPARVQESEPLKLISSLDMLTIAGAGVIAIMAALLAFS